MFSCLGLARFAYSMLLPSMGKGLLLGYAQMGFIGTGNFAGYLVLRLVITVSYRAMPGGVSLPVPGARGRLPLRYARDLRPLAAIPLDAISPSLHRPLRGTPRCAPWHREARTDMLPYI